MKYKKQYISKSGYTPISSPGQEDCSLKLLHFGMIELEKKESVVFDTEDKEWGLIILSGHADFTFDNICWKNVGGRRSVFEGNATSVYLPRNKRVTVTGREHVKIACCNTPVGEDTQPELIGPERVKRVTLGVKPWERETTFIIDDKTNARRLTIGEVYCTPGNWAGFPPHKHDADQMPNEGIMEEIYYFLFQPDQGFAIQKLYTKDLEIDETYTVKQDELVEFPKGYHTTVGAPGYQTYFLWMMAGEQQGFFRSNDPDHDWVSAVENMVKNFNYRSHEKVKRKEIYK